MNGEVLSSLVMTERQRERVAKGRPQFARFTIRFDEHALPGRGSVRTVGGYDPLETMEESRLGYLGKARPGRLELRDEDRAWHRAQYLAARKAAMRLVDLPLDDTHLLVSKETADFFNSLARTERALRNHKREEELANA